jgi:hypothetical protein
MEELLGVGVMVALIILASSVHRLVDRKTRNSIPGEAEERILARMDELDRRITDVQDILITLDDKLNRQS